MTPSPTPRHKSRTALQNPPHTPNPTPTDSYMWYTYIHWAASIDSSQMLLQHMQYTATHCNSLQHTATHCNTQLFTERKCCCNTCRILKHTATHYSTLQLTATRYNTQPFIDHTCCAKPKALQHTATHCNTPQRTALWKNAKAAPSQKHCNTLQHTVKHSPWQSANAASSQKLTQCQCSNRRDFRITVSFASGAEHSSNFLKYPFSSDFCGPKHNHVGCELPPATPRV